MNKEILFLCGSYCPSLESFKTSLVQQCYDESFREELLTYFADGVLARWLKERGFDFALEPAETHSDIALFKSIYQSVLGDPCFADLSCDFFKYAELVGFQAGEISRPIKFRDSQQIRMRGRRLSFVFKQKKTGNEVFRLSLKKDKKVIETKEMHIDSGTSEQDKVITFQVDSMTGKVDLVEGSNNVVCSLTLLKEYLELTCDSPRRKNKTICLKLYSITSDFYMTEIITDDSQVSSIIDPDLKLKLTTRDGIGFEGARCIKDELNNIYQDWNFEFPTVKQLMTALDMPPFSLYNRKYSFHLGDYHIYPSDIYVNYAVAFVAKKR